MKYKSLPLILLLSACAIGPDFIAPDSPDVTRYTMTDMAKVLTSGGKDKGQTLKLGQTVSAQWWKLFHSKKLNELVMQAIYNNQTLVAAKATLAGAQESIRTAESVLYPQLDANGKAQHTITDSGNANLYTVGATASYAPDVFGGTRRSVEQQEALADNQLYQLGAAYLTLTGNVTTQSINIASAKAQLDALTSIVTDDEKNLRLVRESFDAGKSARTDVLAAESQLANDKTQLTPTRQQVSVAKQAIIVLLSTYAAKWQPPEFMMNDFILPDTLPVSLPSKLVHQRPDILAAEAQLRADSAAIGIAEAQRYPSINLTASTALQSIAVNTLFSGASLATNLIGGVAAPLFHGGALEAQKNKARDAYDASLASYQQTVVVAFGQVADTLRTLSYDADTLKSQKRALDIATASLTLQRISYKSGKSDLLQLLNASRAAQQARLGYVKAQSQRYQDIVQLFIAMGGGLWGVKDKIDIAVK
ncbi:MAG: efflux transporter outer membrane subunit [Alphaproteobacteria bacterium]|nr:efflux transporter outer membrane subunit [Alphaproteobacteria bacterium]